MLRLERFENSFLVQLDHIRGGETLMEFTFTLKELHEGMLEDAFIERGLLKTSEETLVAKDFVTLNGEYVEQEIEMEVFINGVWVRDLEGELNF